MLKVGDVVGDVELVAVVGEGAWSRVWEGYDPNLGKVAVKQYRPSHTNVPSGGGGMTWQDAVDAGSKSFLAEGRIIRLINSPYVVRVQRVFEQDDDALVIMDFVEGRTLSEVRNAGGFSTPAEVERLLELLLTALEQVHQAGVIHRDIAPDNIMIDARGHPVLIDFGGAAAGLASVSRAISGLVKDGYSPPEQYDGAASDDVKRYSDLYALAAVMFYLIEGRAPPVAIKRLQAVVSGLKDPLPRITAPSYSPAWLAAVTKALELSPRDRPQSVQEWRALMSGKGGMQRARGWRFYIVRLILGFVLLVGVLRCMFPKPGSESQNSSTIGVAPVVVDNTDMSSAPAADGASVPPPTADSPPTTAPNSTTETPQVN